MRTLLMTGLLLAACGQEDAAELEQAGDIILVPPITSALHQIRPHDTDPAIGTGSGPYATNEYHYVYDYDYNPSPFDPVVEPLLFVLLPGGGPLPGGGLVQAGSYSDVMLTARSMGYHVIGLDYGRPQALQAMCGSDFNCYYQARSEISFGTQISPDVNMVAADSIAYRLRALLDHLVAHYPNGGWERFLDSNGEIIWDRVTLAGHRGFEAFIARYKSVHRVVMFAGPVDGKDIPSATDPTPATWITTNATDVSRYYGIVHTLDSAQNHFERVKDSWTQLGMTPSSLTAIESGSLTGVHKMKSSYPCPGGCDEHLITVIPKNQEAEDYHVVAWRYLMGDGD